LTQLGDQRVRASGIETIRGRAQAALAKLGDAEEFQAIVRELESPGSLDAVLKMQYIGGRRAAEAMLESLNGAKFLDDYPDWKYDGKNAPGIVFDHDEAIENTLIKMVVSPPDSATQRLRAGLTYVAPTALQQGISPGLSGWERSLHSIAVESPRAQAIFRRTIYG
jgi:hypothetical protein